MGRKYLVKTWVGGASERYASADTDSAYSGEQVGNRQLASSELHDNKGNADLGFDLGNETLANIEAIKSNKAKRIELLDSLERDLFNAYNKGRIDDSQFREAYATIITERNSDSLDTRTAEEKRLERRAKLLEEKKQALMDELESMDAEDRKIEQAPIIWLKGVLFLLVLGAVGLWFIKRLATYGILQ